MGFRCSSSVVACVMASFLVAVPVLVSAQPSDRSRAEALSPRASDRLQALQHEADKLTADERTLLGDLRKLEVDRQIKAEELREVEAQQSRVAAELETNAFRTRELEAQ